jgi:hypothetical protein
VGGCLEEAVIKNTSDIGRLMSDLGLASETPTPGQSLSSILSGINPGCGRPGESAPAAREAPTTLEAQVLDLQARLDSKSVAIENFTFPTLVGTTKWAIANLPSAPEKALIRVHVVTLLYSIDGELQLLMKHETLFTKISEPAYPAR